MTKNVGEINVKVEMLSTGDEVLHGQIIDTNAAWLADYLFQQGSADERA